MTNLAIETHDVEMKANGHAFDILCDKLYNDPVTAIVRELSTNAYDAHIMGNNESTPFDVYFPTVARPTFVVRDQGCSLAEDEMHLFFTFFEGGKKGDDRVTGGFHLGGKCVLAYTPTYTVRCYHSGEMREYTVIRHKGETPQYHLTHREPSSEPRGLEIIVPVKGEDIAKFRAQTTELVYFPVLPRIHDHPTCSELVADSADSPVSGKDWYLRRREYKYGDPFVVVMGNIRYPVEINKLGRLPGLNSWRYSKWQFVVRAPNNGLDVTASRDGLQYTAKTKDTMTEVIGRTVREYQTAIAARITDAPTYWDACGVYASLNSEGLSLPSRLHWGNREVAIIWSTRRFQEAFQYIIGDTNNQGRGTTRSDERNSITRDDLEHGTIVLVDTPDIPKGVRDVRKWLRQNMTLDEGPSELLLIIPPEQYEEDSNFLSHTDLPPARLKMASDLIKQIKDIKPARRASTGSRTKTATPVWLRFHHAHKPTYCWNKLEGEAVENDSEGGYWIPITRYDPDDSTGLALQNLQELCNHLPVPKGATSAQIIGVRKDDEFFRTSPKWTQLNRDYVTEWMDGLDPKAYIDYQARKDALTGKLPMWVWKVLLDSKVTTLPADLGAWADLLTKPAPREVNLYLWREFSSKKGEISLPSMYEYRADFMKEVRLLRDWARETHPILWLTFDGPLLTEETTKVAVEALKKSIGAKSVK